MPEGTLSQTRSTKKIDQGIFKRRGTYLVPYRDHRGYQRWQTCRTLTDARAFRGTVASGQAKRDTAAKEAAELAAKVEAARPTLEQYAATWLETSNSNLAEITRDSYRDSLERTAVPFFGDRRLADITPMDVDAFVRSLEADGLSVASRRRYVAPLRKLLSVAVRHGVISSNPAREVRIEASRTERRRPRAPKALTGEQYRALLEATPEQWKPLVEFLGLTGTRISEALSARWGDLDLEKHLLRVRESKTDAGVRTVELDDELYRSLVARRLAAKFSSETDPIFASRAGTPVNPNNFRRIFRTAARGAGVPWATPHKLRHTAATMLFDVGWNASQVATHLGHTDASFTLRTYVHPAQRGDISLLRQGLSSAS